MRWARGVEHLKAQMNDILRSGVPPLSRRPVCADTSSNGSCRLLVRVNSPVGEDALDDTNAGVDGVGPLGFEQPLV